MARRHVVRARAGARGRLIVDRFDDDDDDTSISRLPTNGKKKGTPNSSFYQT
jgi:hypothetical protein